MLALVSNVSSYLCCFFVSQVYNHTMSFYGHVLPLYILVNNLPHVSAKTPLYVGALFPLTSEHNDGWTGGNGILPAAQMALDDVNRGGVLKDYELRMIWNDTKVRIS